MRSSVENNTSYVLKKETTIKDMTNWYCFTLVILTSNMVLTLASIYKKALISLVPLVHNALCQQLRCYMKRPNSHILASDPLVGEQCVIGSTLPIDTISQIAAHTK